MLEPRGKANLLLESLGSQSRRDFRIENLQGDGTVVTEVLREEHCREPATSELALDTILAGECGREGFANRHQMPPGPETNAGSLQRKLIRSPRHTLPP